MPKYMVTQVVKYTWFVDADTADEAIDKTVCEPPHNIDASEMPQAEWHRDMGDM